MTNIIAALGFGGYAAGAVVLGQTVLTSNAAVPVEQALGLSIFVAGIVWWMGRKFQAIEDKLDQHSRERQELREKVENLPCCLHGKGCGEE